MGTWQASSAFRTSARKSPQALVEMLKQGAEVKPGWEGFALLFLSGWLLLIIARVLREATEWPLPLAFLAGLTSLLVVRMLGYLLVPFFGLSAQA